MNNEPLKSKSTYYIFFLFLLFVICRLPVIFHNQEINPDESQVLTQALTLKFVSPVWAVAVDGTTSGPLNTYFLYFLNLLGLPLDYTTAHLANVILCVLSLIVIFKICQKLTSNYAAQIAILIPILFLSITQHSDLVSYNSEMLSVLLTSICAYLLVSIYLNTKKWGEIHDVSTSENITLNTTYIKHHTSAISNNIAIPIFALGFVASLVPFAKIQAVFIVLAILILLLVVLIHQKIHFKFYAIGILGAVVFPVFFFGILFKNNVLDYFLSHYIVGNAAISKFGEIDGRMTMTSVSGLDSLKSIFTGIGQSRDLMFLVLNVIVVSAWGLVFSRGSWVVGLKSKTVSTHYPAPVTSFFILHSSFLILFLLTLYAIAKPGIGRVHYFLFLLLPLTVWVSVVVNQSLVVGHWSLKLRGRFRGLCLHRPNLWSVKTQTTESNPKKSYIIHHTSYIVYFLVVITLLNLALRYKSDGVLNKYKTQTTIPATTLGLKIAEYTNPNEAISIWGWACQYHVEIQSPQATRHNHSILETIENYPYRSDYYHEYLKELEQNLPPVIVDAVGAKSCGIKNRSLYNLNQYVELRNFVNNNYFAASKTDDYVVYVRKDRY